jgi:hypothetical protein
MRFLGCVPHTAVVSDCFSSVGGSTTTTEGAGTVSTSSETSEECKNVGVYEINGYDLVMKFGDGTQETWFLSLERDELGEIKIIYINNEVFWERWIQRI